MMMTLRDRRIGLLVLAACLPLCAVTAQTASPSRPLNSLVARSDRPSGPVPAECEQGLSAVPAPRIDVRDVPPPVEPAAAQAPPSGALRSALQETQTALTRNDRPAFDASLARERSLLETYPTGAERRAAEEVVRLHEAAARLWDAQYRAPFFAQEDPEYALAGAWPGYAEAVRRSVFTDQDGRRFYPAAESRDFFTRLAGERLQRTSAAPRTTSTTRRTSSTSRSTPSTSRSTSSTPRSTSTMSRSTSTTSRSTSSASKPRRSTTVAASTPRRSSPSPKPPEPSPKPSPKPAATPLAPSSSSPDRSAPPTVTAEPAPAPAVVTAEDPVTTSAPDAGDVAPPTPAPATADTAVTTLDTSATEVVPVVPQPGRGRSVILPTILILIGLGVLIVLFRASK
jgi:hypothetical protein